MKADPVYWAANVAPLDDATLLRFIDAVEQRRDKYQVAMDAALNEAANVAPLDDATLLRFIDAVKQHRDKYQVAMNAALNEAHRRNLIKKKAAPRGGQS